MRIIFMGSPDFAVPTLQALVDAAHEVVCVYTQPPRPGGRRGKELTPTPVHQRASDLGIEVRHPKSLKSAEEQAAFAALEADVAVVAAYGLILPQAVLDAPVNGCLNVHASILPRWRGAAPIHRAVMAGDNVTELGAQLMVGTLRDLKIHVPIAQDDADATYAAKIDKAEARIDWDRPAQEVVRHVHGLSPFPGAWFDLAGQRVKLLRVEEAEGTGTAGEVLDDRLAIACGDGAIRPIELQRAGKPKMDLDTFLRGNAVAPGTVLG